MSSLPDYIAARLSTPFKWGESDCIHLTIGWTSIVSGRDWLADFAPWKSKREAFQRMRQHGGLAKLFDANFQSIEPNFATDGDIALIGTTTYLFVGRHIVSVGDDGLMFQDRSKAVRAWRCE
jgi:hypothetical protein